MLAEVSFEARQFHSSVRPRPKQSSISATLARVTRACRLKGIVVSISSEAYFALKVNTYAALVISLPTTVRSRRSLAGLTEARCVDVHTLARMLGACGPGTRTGATHGATIQDAK